MNKATSMRARSKGSSLLTPPHPFLPASFFLIREHAAQALVSSIRENNFIKTPASLLESLFNASTPCPANDAYTELKKHGESIRLNLTFLSLVPPYSRRESKKLSLPKGGSDDISTSLRRSKFSKILVRKRGENYRKIDGGRTR